MILIWTISLAIILTILLLVFLLKRYGIENSSKFNLFSGGGFFASASGNEQVASIFVNKGIKKVGPSANHVSINKETSSKAQPGSPIKDSKKPTNEKGAKKASEASSKERIVENTLQQVAISNPPASASQGELSSQVNSFIPLKDILNGGDYSDIANFLAQKGMINLDQKKVFRTEQEAKEFMKSEIISMFNNKYLAIKEKISYYRKKGVDVHVLTLDSMRIPLKIKLLKSDFRKVSMEKVIEVIDNVQKEINRLEESQKI